MAGLYGFMFCILCVLDFIYLSDAMCKYMKRDVAYKVVKSDVVLSGKISKVMEGDSKYFPGIQGAQTIELEAECIYRGLDMAKDVKIYGFGHAEPDYLDEICPFYDNDECIKYIEPTTKATEAPTTPKPEPETSPVTPKPTTEKGARYIEPTTKATEAPTTPKPELETSPVTPKPTTEKGVRYSCSHGRYGTDCKEKCGRCESNETCHHVNGSCPGLCEPGYHGEKCLTVCQKGFYGRNCSSPCGHCAKNATCDHVTGSCPSGYCEPGWKYTPEQRCDQTCNNGWYGVECKEPCGYCRGNKACHHVNGSCFGLCEAGYHGEKCEKSEFSQLLAIQRKMLEFVRELLTRKRSKAELKENGTSPTDFK